MYSYTEAQTTTMPNTQVVGTCSICGGMVTVPTFWWSVVPPTPTCKDCGAVKEESLPVIKMKKLEKRSEWATP